MGAACRERGAALLAGSYVVLSFLFIHTHITSTRAHRRETHTSVEKPDEEHTLCEKPDRRFKIFAHAGSNAGLPRPRDRTDAPMAAALTLRTPPHRAGTIVASSVVARRRCSQHSDQHGAEDAAPDATTRPRAVLQSPSSDAYKERMEIAAHRAELAAASPPLPTSLDALDGEWSGSADVAYGIFLRLILSGDSGRLRERRRAREGRAVLQAMSCRRARASARSAASARPSTPRPACSTPNSTPTCRA